MVQEKSSLLLEDLNKEKMKIPVLILLLNDLCKKKDRVIASPLGGKDLKKLVHDFYNKRKEITGFVTQSSDSFYRKMKNCIASPSASMDKFVDEADDTLASAFHGISTVYLDKKARMMSNLPFHHLSKEKERIIFGKLQIFDALCCDTMRELSYALEPISGFNEEIKEVIASIFHKKSKKNSRVIHDRQPTFS